MKFEQHQCFNGKSLYTFKCRGEIVSFHYNGEALKEQAERKLKLVLEELGEETLDE